jgi:hypothetical protein
MADYPCDFHLARYSGPSARVYMNVYREDEVAAFRMSVCGDCLAEITSEWLARALVKTAEGYWDPPTEDRTLEACVQPRSGPIEPLRSSRRF